MTEITAEIICDSKSHGNVRLTTFKLRYPRWIHAEFMTHRVFSRNASSSRAIPVKRLIKDIRRNPAIPIYWGKNQKGMQSGEPISDTKIKMAKAVWTVAMYVSAGFAYLLDFIGLHKQFINRMLEPFGHINVIVTATDYQNFFALRCHKDAEPHIRLLARKMQELYIKNDPIVLNDNQWHLPFIKPEDNKIVMDDVNNDNYKYWEMLIKISVARCARVSYLTYDQKRPTIAQDLALYERLVGSQPLHASPAEHQAMPDKAVLFEFIKGDFLTQEYRWEKPHLHGNLKGWIQYRKTLPNEFVSG